MPIRVFGPLGSLGMDRFTCLRLRDAGFIAPSDSTEGPDSDFDLMISRAVDDRMMIRIVPMFEGGLEWIRKQFPHLIFEEYEAAWPRETQSATENEGRG